MVSCETGIHFFDTKDGPCVHCGKSYAELFVLKRLYFWFKGADESRIGGPWWVRDFASAGECQRFLDDIKPFLYTYQLTDGSESYVAHDVRPPDPPK